MTNDIGSAVRALILQSADIQQMVGQRVYSDQLPQGAKTPAIVYMLVTEIANDILGGPLGMEDATFQMDCYGATRAEAIKLWGYIKPHLAGFRGTVNGVPIRTVYQDSGVSYATDLPEAGSDAYRYRCVQDFGFVYGSLERSC